MDAIAIGRKTYNQIVWFGDWPYLGKTSYIFSRFPKDTQRPDIKFVSERQSKKGGLRTFGW